jgi:hypothetical protein
MRVADYVHDSLQWGSVYQASEVSKGKNSSVTLRKLIVQQAESYRHVRYTPLNLSDEEADMVDPRNVITKRPTR